MVESNDFSQLKRLRSAKQGNHLKVDPSHRKLIFKTLRKYFGGGHERGLQILSNRTTRHSWCRPVIPEVNLQDSWKIFRKSPRKGVGDIVKSTWFDSNRTTPQGWCRPVIPEVDLEDTWKIFRKWLRKGVADFVESNEYPNLKLKYVLSSFAHWLPVRRIAFTNDEPCK